MAYRSKPLFRRPDTWRFLACMNAFMAVLNLAVAGYSVIDGDGSPVSYLLIALFCALGAIFSLVYARQLERS